MVGLSSTQLWSFNLPDTLAKAAELGYTGVEVWAEQVWLHGDQPAVIRRQAGACGLRLTVHSSSWDLNLTARNEAIRKASIQEVVRSIDLAAAIGADMITVHPGHLTLHGYDLDWHWERQIDAFRYLADEGQRRGVQVNAELMEPIKKEFCITAADMNRLLAAVDHPNLGVTFDAAHISLELNPAEVLRALNRVDEIHLSDSTPTKLHVPLGRGQVNLVPVLAEAARRGLTMTIEGYEVGTTADLATWNKQMFDLLWAQAETGTTSSKAG